MCEIEHSYQQWLKLRLWQYSRFCSYI